jgi:hypothetical protein
VATRSAGVPSDARTAVAGCRNVWSTGIHRNALAGDQYADRERPSEAPGSRTAAAGVVPPPPAAAVLDPVVMLAGCVSGVAGG